MRKNRIWEIDALRGLCVIGMVAFHLVYDLTELYGILDFDYPRWLSFAMNWGGVLFFLISGVSATLSRRSFRRGSLVFSCGLLCTAVTFGMYLAGFDRSVIIYFGTLHSLGTCMMLWHFLRRIPTLWLAAAAVGLILPCLWLRSVTVPFPYLIPLGLVTPDFVTSDYFPLLPWLGFFLLGAALGRTLYAGKTTRFPGAAPARQPLRFLCGCGRAALPVYLLHQPVLALLCLPAAL